MKKIIETKSILETVFEISKTLKDSKSLELVQFMHKLGSSKEYAKKVSSEINYLSKTSINLSKVELALSDSEIEFISTSWGADIIRRPGGNFDVAYGGVTLITNLTLELALKVYKNSNVIPAILENRSTILES